VRTAKILGGAVALALLLVFVVLQRQSSNEEAPIPSTPIESARRAHPELLYGRVFAEDGSIYEGRLRWGGNEEAFWSDHFNGFKDENPWAAHAPTEQLKERRPLEVLGVEIAKRESPVDLGRPFLARFGDLASVERDGSDLVVTLKSGTIFRLDRLEADDFADGVRIWDRAGGTVDLDEVEIRAIELLAAPQEGGVSNRLHGTVHTRQREFTGFVQWNRHERFGSDELDGFAEEGELSLRFDTIRSIARDSSDSARVELRDGRELVLSGTREVGDGHRGIYVDDLRYGRVVIPWEAFERVELSSGRSGPAYDYFPPGAPLTGSVTTRDGRRASGRLVYDLDESETTETLDAPADGVSYTILFGLVASIVLPDPDENGSRHARVTLHSGEELELEASGDLGAGNAGLLIFAANDEPAEYVPWVSVRRIEFDRPEQVFPPIPRL
jgi:hypothetical protein